MTFVGVNKPKIDLLKRYSYDPEKHKKTVTRLKFIVPGVAAVVIMLGAIAFVFIRGISLDNDIDDTQVKIDELKREQEEALELESRYNTLTFNYTNLVEAQQKAQTESSRYSYFGAQLLDEVKSACGDLATVEIMDFSSSGILFTFETTAANYTDIAGIVDRIEALGRFDSVVYTGYSESGEGYSFSIVCKFNEEETTTESEAQ